MHLLKQQKDQIEQMADQSDVGNQISKDTNELNSLYNQQIRSNDTIIKKVDKFIKLKKYATEQQLELSAFRKNRVGWRKDCEETLNQEANLDDYEFKAAETF